FLLRTRRHLGWVAHGQLAADVIAATGLVYLTGGADSIFTILYPLAIVSGAIGLGRRGAALGAATSCIAFCVLAWSMQIGIVPPAAAELDRVPLAPGKLAVVMAANLSAFMLVGGLSSLLAEQLQGARSPTAPPVFGGLAAALAHEIRNPLASMCGSIEILGASPGLDEQERRLMSVVRSEAERLEALVREFLSFARPISPAFEPLDAARAVTETVELFRQEVAERGIELVARAEEPVFVRADSGQVRQVLWNLLGNAA